MGSRVFPYVISRFRSDVFVGEQYEFRIRIGQISDRTLVVSLAAIHSSHSI